PFANPDIEKWIKSAPKSRKPRRLKDGELEALEHASEKCLGLNRFYVPLAIYLAIESGMRKQEIFNLTWDAVPIETRRIEIRKSKTDHMKEQPGRTIVLTLNAADYLALLRVALVLKREFKENGRIFPMTKEAFTQSFADLCKKRAKISDL